MSRLCAVPSRNETQLEHFIVFRFPQQIFTEHLVCAKYQACAIQRDIKTQKSQFLSLRTYKLSKGNKACPHTTTEQDCTAALVRGARLEPKSPDSRVFSFYHIDCGVFHTQLMSCSTFGTSCHHSGPHFSSSVKYRVEAL